MWGWQFDNPCCKATLWKIDPSDGSIVWRKDRQTNSFSFELYDDGSDVWAYEVGAFHASNLSVTKWLVDADDEPEWSHNIGNNSGALIRRSSDGDIWAIGPSGTHIIDDSDGSTVNSSSSPSSSAGAGHSRAVLYDSSSGSGSDMILCVPANITLYDSTISSVVSLTDIVASSTGHPLGLDVTGSLNGLVYTEDSTKEVVNVDDALAEVARDNSNTYTATVAANASKAFAPNWLIDVGTMTADWGSSGSVVVDYDIDGSNNVYSVTSALSSTVTRRNASTGSVDWTSGSIGSFITISQIKHGGSRVFVSGSLSVSGTPYGMVALNDSDGSFDWGFTNTALGREIRYFDSHVFLCGNRGP